MMDGTAYFFIMRFHCPSDFCFETLKTLLPSCNIQNDDFLIVSSSDIFEKLEETVRKIHSSILQILPFVEFRGLTFFTPSSK